jgi:predicted secreted protein
MLSKYNIENRKATKSKENPFAGTGIPGWAHWENRSAAPGHGIQHQVTGF